MWTNGCQTEVRGPLVVCKELLLNPRNILYFLSDRLSLQLLFVPTSATHKPYQSIIFRKVLAFLCFTRLPVLFYINIVFLQGATIKAEVVAFELF